MNKAEFLAALNNGLKGLPQADIDEQLTFYGEMIDDRMEEGFSEAEAVSEIGSVEAVISQISADTPLSKPAKEQIKPKRRIKGWEILLLVLGSPIWLSLGIAAAAVLLSVYVSLWSVIISLWAVFASFVACFIGGLTSGIILAFFGKTLSGIALIGAALILAGLSIFTFFGCKAATKGTIILTKKILLSIKKRFIKKEDA